MTIAPLGTATPTPLDPKATSTDMPAIPFADVLAAMHVAPTAEPVASDVVQPPAPSCQPQAGNQPPASPTPVENAAPWIPAQGRDDGGKASPSASAAPQACEATQQSNHPGEGRGPGTTGPQLDPGLRRGGHGEEVPKARLGVAPVAPPPAPAVISTVTVLAVDEPTTPLDCTPLPGSPEPARATHRAAVFNERGLLRDVGTVAREAVASHSHTPGSPREIRAEMPTADTAEAASIASPQAPAQSAATRHRYDMPINVFTETEPSPTASTNMPASAATAATTVSVSAPDAPHPVLQATPQQRAAPAPSTTRTQTRELPEPATKRPTKPRAPIAPEQQDKTDARLSLDAAPHGLTLLAAVARTDRDERIRLRDRIAGLLSARGFVLADVRVGTAALPLPKDR